ncbi:RNA 2',3'-cyclic phosphodiesterase [Gammaproteobacteria bacterium]|nr:RNA 2',3'-cyclic phosphodiesterase [Gammaproteobacteria bacterium]QOJ30844.1 MAG: RNA 2',3'-cyclic phosphodiesterase [Gammaproteobacteria bacterium]CAG0940635.1 RNA 2',3'-cyclic phosphodiesterase [Gammaproteobacteria bacterium]
MKGAAAPARRLFFALWPDPPVREALWRETREAVRRCGGQPVPPDNLHLTLLFLGQVAEARQATLVAAVRQLAAPRVELVMDRYGWFAAARVLWLGCGEVPAALGSLARDLAGLATAAGLRADPRPFQPHVTLARKLRNPADLAPPRPVTWRASGFVLAESLAGPAGPHYELRARFADSR